MIEFLSQFSKYVLGAAAGLTIATIIAIIIGLVKWREEKARNASLDALLKSTEAILDTVEEILSEIRGGKK